MTYAAIGFGLGFGIIGAIGYFKLMGAFIEICSRKLGITKHNYFDANKTYNPYEKVRLLGDNYQVLTYSDDKTTLFLKNLEEDVKYRHLVLHFYENMEFKHKAKDREPEGDNTVLL